MQLYFNLIIISIFITVNASAQEQWDLQKCITHAQKQSISIQQANLAIDQAEISEKISKHSRYPNLNGSSNLNWNFGRSIEPTTNEFVSSTFLSNNLSLNTGVTLYNGGRIKNQIQQSKINKEAAMQDAEDTERTLALNVATLYLNVLFAKDRMKIADRQYELAKTQLDQINKLIRVGSRPENDRYDIEAQITNAEQTSVQSKNVYEINVLNLKQLLRLEPSAPFEIVTPPSNLEVTDDPDILTFDEVYRKGLTNQPNIKAGDLRYESAILDKKVANAALLPSLTVGASVGTNYSNKGISIDGFDQVVQQSNVLIDGTPAVIGTNQLVPITSQSGYFTQLDENVSYGVGFGLNIPIYNRYQNKGNVERAKIGIESARLSTEQLKENLKINIQQALADARAAKRAYIAAQKNNKAQSAAFNNAQKRFDLGAINTYDYNNALTTKENADINLLIAKYDYLFRVKVIDFYLGKPLNIN